MHTQIVFQLQQIRTTSENLLNVTLLGTDRTRQTTFHKVHAASFVLGCLKLVGILQISIYFFVFG